MFLKIMLLLIVTGLIFWAGMWFERSCWKNREKMKRQPAIKSLPKKFNWKVGEER